MSSNDVRVRRVSGRQLDLMWEYLNSHRDIAMAYNRSLQAKEYSKQKWAELAGILNCQGEGTHKDWKGWSKYWVDYKAKLKKRVAAIRTSQSRTGGGPCAEPPLTNNEKNFLQLLGDNYGQGLPGVQVEPFIAHAENADVGVSPSILQILPEPQGTPSLEEPYGVALAVSPARTVTPPAVPTSAQITPRRSPRRRILHITPPATSQPIVAATTVNRRRRQRERPMSQEAARRALVQSSQEKTAAAVRSSRALEVIGEGIVGIENKLGNIESALSDRLVNVGVKTPIRMIKDLCVSLFDSSSSGVTTSRLRKLGKASKGVDVSPEVRSFCCQHVQEKATQDHTTQFEKTTPKTLQWAVQNSSCDATINTNKMTCTCATQHYVKNRNIGTWLGHHCNDLHRAANEHKRKTVVEKQKGARRSFVPRIISEVFDISHAGAESSVNTTESSANDALVRSKSEISFNSNDTRTDTTICSIATVEYHEERRYKRRQPKTAVITKANRSTLTDKAKVCDVSTITNDWWSPIVERKERRKEKEIFLEKKKGDYTMNEKVHKRLRNKGITTDGRIVTFRSRTQVIPPGITDIMSPSRYLLESQRYYNELFSSRFYTPHVYAMTPVQKYQDSDKYRSSASIRHHTRRGHKNKKYDESYSKKSDSIKADSPRRRLQPNLFKQNKIYRSTPRPHHWKKLKGKKKQGQDILNNMDERQIT